MRKKPAKPTTETPDKYKELYQSIIAASPDGITILDPGGAIVYASPKSYELFGLESQNEAIGRLALEFVSPKDQERFANEFSSFFNEPDERTRQFTFIRKDGTPFEVEINAALLHDSGKALTHEVEGSHALIGGEIARKYGESAKIVNAIAAHHEEVKAETILAPLVDAADALSGARPGARREVLESYVKRLEDLEAIARSFRGVEKCFAVQAGREMRVIVEPSQVSDEDSLVLAREVAKKIETDMTYPGQIRVTVIRETRATELAK